MKISPCRLVALLAGALLVSNAAAFDFVTSRGPAIGQAALSSYTSASEMLNLPAGGFSNQEWRIETGFNRAYDLSDFNQVYLAGGYRFGRFTGALGFSQFGKSDLYAEQTIKSSLTTHFDSLSVSLTGSHLIAQFGGDYENLSATTAGLGASYRLPQAILTLTADDLTSPELVTGNPFRRPQYSLYAEYRGKESFSLMGRVLLEETERPRFSLAQRIMLGENSAFMLGISTAPFQFGGGVELGLSGGFLNYGAAYHPVLGLSQTIAVSYGRGHKATEKDDLK